MKQRSSGAGGAHVNLFGRPMFFLAKEDDKGGGGGSGGEGGDDKKPDPALIAAIAEAMQKPISAAVADHFKRAKKDNDKAIADAVKAALDAAGVKPRTEDDPPDEDKTKDKGGSGGGGAKVDPAFAAQLEKLQKQLDAQTKETQAEKAKREKAEIKAQRDEERQLITSWLAGADNNGRPVVRAEVMDDVAEILSKRLVRNPEDPAQIFWRGDKWKDIEGADNSDNYEDVKAALEKWKDSPKGKAYAPPASIGGGGFGNPRSGGPGPRKGDEPMSDAEIGQLIYGQTRR